MVGHLTCPISCIRFVLEEIHCDSEKLVAMFFQDGRCHSGIYASGKGHCNGVAVDVRGGHLLEDDVGTQYYGEIGKIRVFQRAAVA